MYFATCSHSYFAGSGDGFEVLEALPSRHIPYSLVDPYILVHEAVVPNSAERAGLETFYRYAAEAGLVSAGFELRFF